MEQSNQFYQQLPFTLQDEHLNCEYLIFGTGLQESTLAAYLAKMQEKKVLILDLEKTYGSCIKTITLKELLQLSQKLTHQRLYEFYVPEKYKLLNQNFENSCIQNKSFRGYNIDVEPSVFFGNSITCESLKQADMDKYMDFRLINHLFMYNKGKFEEVPLSKGKIFQSKSLSLGEKKTLLTALHTLIKLYQKHANVQQDQNSTKEFDKGFGQVSQELLQYLNQNLQNSCIELLQKITKKNKKIMDFIVYIICNYQYNYCNALPSHAQQSLKVKNFIVKFGKFINSCGIYGETPYLYVDNGMGDIPQAFSRIASIFGSTFILHPKIQIESIIQTQETVTVKSNLAPGKELKLKRVFYGQTFKDLYQQNNQMNSLEKQQIFRVIVLCKKLGGEESCPFLSYFLDITQFANPVCMLMLDESSHTCPNSYAVYQFSTILDAQFSAKSKEQRDKIMDSMAVALINKLVEIRGNQFESSIQFTTSYIRSSSVQSQAKPYCQEQSKQVLLKGYGGLDLDYHFESFIQIVGKKDNYFRKSNPYQDEQEEDSDGEIKNSILQKLENIKIKPEKEDEREQKGQISENQVQRQQNQTQKWEFVPLDQKQQSVWGVIEPNSNKQPEISTKKDESQDRIQN